MRKRRSKLTHLARVLRRSGNIAEDRLWRHVRNRNLGGFKFYRSFVIGDYIADFACPELNLVVEMDGSQHTLEKDKTRNDFMTANGWSVARFPSGHILSQTDRVLETIAAICEDRISDHSVDYDFQFYPRLPMDEDFMRQAIALGRPGRTWPNPSVGCVIVKDSVVIATGTTGDGGRPHAEETALNALAGQAYGATAYVTLEPCGHRSTGAPSCSERLIAAGVARVVYACADPSHLASDIGPDRMRMAGLTVEGGCLSDDAQFLIAPFAHYLKTGLPMVQTSETDVGFDAEFAPEQTADLRAELAAWAARGYRHLWVKPQSELAGRLRTSGLLIE